MCCCFHHCCNQRHTTDQGQERQTKSCASSVPLPSKIVRGSLNGLSIARAARMGSSGFFISWIDPNGTRHRCAAPSVGVRNQGRRKRTENDSRSNEHGLSFLNSGCHEYADEVPSGHCSAYTTSSGEFILTLEGWHMTFASAWGGACESCGTTGDGARSILPKSRGSAGFTSPNWRMDGGRPGCA